MPNPTTVDKLCSRAIRERPTFVELLRLIISQRSREVCGLSDSQIGFGGLRLVAANQREDEKENAKCPHPVNHFRLKAFVADRRPLSAGLRMRFICSGSGFSWIVRIVIQGWSARKVAGPADAEMYGVDA
jgi:hypothetical protein